MQSAECRVQNAECRVQNAECRMQSAECRVQNAELRRFLGGAFVADASAIKAPEKGIGSYLFSLFFELHIATKMEMISLISASKLACSLSLMYCVACRRAIQ